MTDVFPKKKKKKKKEKKQTILYNLVQLGWLKWQDIHVFFFVVVFSIKYRFKSSIYSRPNSQSVGYRDSSIVSSCMTDINNFWHTWTDMADVFFYQVIPVNGLLCHTGINSCSECIDALTYQVVWKIIPTPKGLLTQTRCNKARH